MSSEVVNEIMKPFPLHIQLFIVKQVEVSGLREAYIFLISFLLFYFNS